MMLTRVKNPNIRSCPGTLRRRARTISISRGIKSSLLAANLVDERFNDGRLTNITERIEG